jgi:hypothetical protein
MRIYTERVRFSLPTEAKERLKAEAQYHGISLSEHIRRKVHRQMELEDEIESRSKAPPLQVLVTRSRKASREI